MPNERYVKGRNHENYTKRKYEALGFACIRSSGSKGAVDVIAIKKGPYCKKMRRHCPVIHAIQCKPKHYRFGRAEREKIQAWTQKTGLEVALE